MENEIQTPITNQEESLKLTKNSKGYNWEIKILKIDIERMENLNNEMKLRFKDE